MAANLGGKEAKLRCGSVRESQTREEKSRKGDVRSLGSFGSVGGTKVSVLEYAEEGVDALRTPLTRGKTASCGQSAGL